MKNIHTQWGVIFKALSPSIQTFIEFHGITQDQFKNHFKDNEEFIEFDESDVYLYYWINDDKVYSMGAPLDDFYIDQYYEYVNYCSAEDMHDAHPYSISDWKERRTFEKSEVREWIMNNLHKLDTI